MNKILQICVGGNVGSTGNIAEVLGIHFKQKKWASYIAFSRNIRESESITIKIGNKLDIYFHGFVTRLFDYHGLASKRATKKLINDIIKIDPDIYILHHLHGYYINFVVLFDYLNRVNKPIIWIFHDFWSITGHCSHFTKIGCNKWKDLCYECPQMREYPKSILVDRSKNNYILKKRTFSTIDNLHIINVSKFSDQVVSESFLKFHQRSVIYNGIDTNIFCPTDFTDIEQKFLLKNKFVILGVSGVWSKKKGFNDFIELANKIDAQSIIILIGVPKNLRKYLPKNILTIEFTEDKSELAQFYSRADVYLNLSVEETFGLTTVEALACGTPVIVYNSTASPELISIGTGFSVEPGNIDEIMNTINIIKQNGKNKYGENCRNHVLEKYDIILTNNSYFELANDLVEKNKNLIKNKMKCIQVCVNCVMDTSDRNISFDEKGVCDHCNSFEKYVKPYWKPDGHSEKQLQKLVNQIKEESVSADFDCILGLSGGVDSSYMLHKLVKDFGLRPLVFHVDCGWNSELAVHNINVMIEKLGLDLYTEVINWEEIKDFQLAFFKSGVPHLDIPQDHAFVSVMYKFADKHNIKYIMNGGNFATECVQYPKYWLYYGTDMPHLNDIMKKFGTVKMNSYPFSSIFNHKIYLRYLKGVKVIKPLNYLEFNKKEALKILEDEYGWKPYPQKHFESRFTKFYEGYWLPERFGFDTRKVQFSSLILTGQMTRDEALEKLSKPAYDPETIEDEFNYIATKLGISSVELRGYFNMPKKYYWDYKNISSIFDLGAKVLQLFGIEKSIRR